MKLRFYRQSNIGKHQFEWSGLSSDKYSEWRTIVGMYSRRKISIYTDKFPALSGLAKKLSKLLQDEYIAGLWRKDLVDGLLWAVEYPNPVYVDIPKGLRAQAFPSLESLTLFQPVRDESEYVAPSWSWASVDMPVYYDDYPKELEIDLTAHEPPYLEIQDVRITPADASPFGGVTSGKLVVQGQIFPLTLTGKKRHYELLNESNDTVAR